MITGLLTFDDSKRLTAREVLNTELFNPRTRLFGTQDKVLSSLTNMLRANSFQIEEVKPALNLV